MTNVTVSLTFDTDQPSSLVLQSVMAALRTSGENQPVAVHTYTDDTDQIGEVVHLVASEDPTGAISSVVAFIGRGRASSAHAWAEEMGGVIVELPIDTDCRTEDA